MSDSPRVLFVGGTPRGLRVGRLLRDRGVNLVGVVVMAEDAHESVTVSPEIAQLATDAGVWTLTTKRLTPEDVRHVTDELRPDLIVMVGWRTLVPEEFFAFPRLGCVGVHDSPLPRYRGFAPPNWAVINGERRWGVTLFHLADGVDEGDMIGQEHFDVAERATAPEVYDQIVDATISVVDRHLAGLLDGTAPRIPQDHSRATYACGRTPEDGEIDWSTDTGTIDRLIRGLTFPYPGAWTTWKGERLIVWEAAPVPNAPIWEGRIPGRVVGFNAETADVLTVDGVLRVARVQKPGADPVSAGQVLRSVKSSLGR